MADGGRRNTMPNETVRTFLFNQEWNMRVYLERQLWFPTEISTTSLLPWSTKGKSVLLTELTVEE